MKQTLRRRDIRIFLVVVLMGAAARLAVVWTYTAAPGNAATGTGRSAGSSGIHVAHELPDEVQYWDMAASLAAGTGLRDELGYRASRMPIYPGFLSLFVSLRDGRVMALSVQALLGALAGGFCALLASRMCPGPGDLVPYLAGLLVAFDPFLVYMSRLLLTETLFTAALCAFWASAWTTSDRSRPASWTPWLVAGCLAGLCIYLRPSSAALPVVWCGFVVARRRFDGRGLLRAGLVLLLPLVLLVPWAARNHALLGEWRWLTTRAGISLFDGLHPRATGASDLGPHKDLGVGELAWDAHFRAQALHYLESEPVRVLRLAGCKFVRTWNLWPNAAAGHSLPIKVMAGMWSVLIFSTALLAIVRCGLSRSTIIGLLLPAGYFTILHLVFVGSVRYRLPAMPMIEILSAFAIAALLRRLRHKQGTLAGGSSAC